MVWLFTPYEIIDILIMTLVIGYIFKDVFQQPVHTDDIVEQYRHVRTINWREFWWGSALVAPAVIVHELAHKFTALAFGMQATFFAACSSYNAVHGGFFNFLCGLTIISVLLKAIGFGFLFFVPGYVQSSGGTHLQNSLVALAGPLVHLVFWLGAAYVLKNKKMIKKLPHKRRMYLFFFKQINMFLFIFNILPIPGFDGFSFAYNFVRVITG